MKKVLFLVPHLSTGGMPQYTYDLMRKIKNDVEVYCIEYNMISPDFVVQRNKIIQLLGDKFISLGNEKTIIFDIISEIEPDIIHLQEIPEYFLDYSISTRLYEKDRNYLIVETSHDSSFTSSNKRFFPDHFALISEFQKREFSKLNIPISIVESDIEYKERQDRSKGLQKLGLDPNLKHVVNVGLFTPRKNQLEAIEYARNLEQYPIQFHFIGNQADNFADYWRPILENLPPNVKIWGERSDVDDFYSCMDMMLFTSRGNGNDKETSPLVIRESIGYNLPAMIFNLPVYLGMYDKYDTIRYMDFDDKSENIKMILKTLNIPEKENQKELANSSYDKLSNKIFYSVNEDMFDVVVSVRDIDSRAVIWSTKHEHIPSGIQFWMIPVPKDFYDFETEKNFGGLIIEICKEDSVLYSKPFRIKNIEVNKPVSKIRNNTEPTFINYNEFFVDKIYSKFLEGKSFQTVVDVGANVGLWTEYIKNVANVNHVFMVEPNHVALKILNNSFANNSTITIVDSAMSDIDGELEFFVNQENSTISSMLNEHKHGGGNFNISYKVNSVRFDTFMKMNGLTKIDLIKIDIEGAEYDLFNSMTEDDFDKIDNILVEYHINQHKTMYDVHMLIKKFEHFGFKCELNSMHSIGGFIFANKKRTDESKKLKIQAIHLLTNITEDREQKSIEFISKLSDYGINYKQQINKVYDELPPSEFCNRPYHISEENKSFNNGYGTLTGRHYGCYLAHTDGIKNIDDDYDYTIIFEADASIDTSYEEFVEIIYECCKQSEYDNVYFFGLANNFSPDESPVNLMFSSATTQNLAHAYLIPNRYKKWYLDRISDVPWDVSDIWFNEVFQRNKEKRYITTKCYSSQITGLSLIDRIIK